MRSGCAAVAPARALTFSWHRCVPFVGLLLLWCVLCLQPMQAWARDVPANVNGTELPQATAAGQGFVEKAEISDGVLTLTGWAAARNPSVFVTLVQVWLGDQSIYRGRLGYLTPRSDVVEATGQPLWLSSGFHLPLQLPDDVSAQALPLRVQVTNGDGSQFDLGVSDAARQVQVPHTARQPSWKAKLALGLAFALPALCLLLACAGRGHSSPAGHGGVSARAFAASVIASFALLVAAGWSGSSLPLLLERAQILEHDGAPYLGQARDVRRDEWLIVTPLAMSQRVSPEPFASVNTLHGVYGQNMNVVGMSGAPTRTLAEVAKPASWGFLVLDLKRALAWYWWLPFFACFLALWALLRSWFALDWRHAAVLASLVPGSAYAVGWSGWPAYVSFFPILAAWAATGAMRAQRAWQAAVLGGMLGWAAAGFVLVLYPGWQIPLAWLMGLLTLAHGWQMRRQLQFGVGQLLALIVAAAVGALLLGAWWRDAADAIAALGNTVYPGQRSMELGGYVEPWHLSKGIANLVTLYESSQWSIPSDAAGHVYLLLPLAVASVVCLCVTRAAWSMVLVLWLVVAFVLVHMFVGIPAWLARATLWGNVPAFRLDVVLGLAQVLLLAWVMECAPQLRQWADGSRARTVLLQALACTTATVVAWVHWRALAMMPVPMQQWLTPAVLVLILAASAWLAWLLVRGRVVLAVGVTAAWTLAVSFPFNPLQQAPKDIQLVPGLRTALQSSAAGERPSAPRVAVVNNDVWMGALPIAGVRVVNSVFYDPPLRFWRDLDPSGAFKPIYNRYQNLLITLEPELETATWRITSPRMDAVVLNVQPERFDFAKVQADFVLAGLVDGAQLQANPRLALQATDGAHWMLFRVTQQP